MTDNLYAACTSIRDAYRDVVTCKGIPCVRCGEWDDGVYPDCERKLKKHDDSLISIVETVPVLLNEVHGLLARILDLENEVKSLRARV